METLIQQEQIERAFQEAEKIGWSFGGWALTKDALKSFCHFLPKLNVPLNILELGAGQSTLFWHSLMQDNNLNLTIATFEHHPIWADYVRKRIGKCTSPLRIELLDLKVVNEEEWAKIFSKPKEAPSIWNSLGTKVQKEKFEDCTLHNAFYAIPPELFATMKSIDAIIVDGPHGNGRSLAFPLFYNYFSPNAVVLIDDVDHYKFLGNLLSLFNFQILVKKIKDDERWAILRLQSRGN